MKNGKRREKCSYPGKLIIEWKNFACSFAVNDFDLIPNEICFKISGMLIPQ